MAMTQTRQARDVKAGWCGRCRDANHSLCAAADCVCPGGRNRHPGRPANPARSNGGGVRCGLLSRPRRRR